MAAQLQSSGTADEHVKSGVISSAEVFPSRLILPVVHNEKLSLCVHFPACQLARLVRLCAGALQQKSEQLRELRQGCETQAAHLR